MAARIPQPAQTSKTPETIEAAVTRRPSTKRAVSAGALTVLALGLAITPASAGSPDHRAPGAYSAAQLAAARTAATTDSTITLLDNYFAHAPARGAAHAVRTGQSAPRAVGRSVTVSSLNPAFVAGESGAPVARPSFVATDFVSPTGQTATVQTALTAKGWQIVTIASGTDESDFTAKAQGRGTVFREPQINAWYTVRGDEILPLNTEARAVVGPSGTSLAAYYHHVHSAYGTRLPGSSYDKKGMAGGFGDAAADAAARNRSADTTAPGKATQATATGTTGRVSGNSATTLLALVAAAALGGGALVARRLRRSR
ncbi:hypothetical protein [Streptomyces sp. Tu 6176]|uniref:hypothetical protein n=1 Tax=Streptomyces sp. Tu 6176 TaxID=1470557 RepID=UPI00099897A1|nr:hypothetical protein [Streptomyces sp. Tu 6176]